MKVELPARPADHAVIDARLPAHYDRSEIEAERHSPWLMASLLEEGDSCDLRWLVARFREARLGRWVAERGARQLSARSLAFWRLVLDVEAVSEAPGDELWLR